eukprot:376695_1
MASLDKADSVKKKGMFAAISAHKKMKAKFAVQVSTADLDDENVHLRTDEVSQNSLTATFLTLRNGLWHEFPCAMKFVWIACILTGAGVQWATTWLLYFHFTDLHDLMEKYKDLEERDFTLDRSKAEHVFAAVMSCALLFSFVLGESRKALLTLKHYWAILEVGVLEYWLFSMFIGDILLQLAVMCLSVIAIGLQDNISDQLGISLSFFFVLEFDEWLYIAFIKDYDVVQEEDFTLQSVDAVLSKQDFYRQKTKNAIIWG